jgi:CHASE3 domain sensor protein
MSKHQQTIKPKAIFNLSIFIILCMLCFAVFYLYLAQDNNEAIQDIWQHFKALSLIVVGYWFGNSNK